MSILLLVVGVLLLVASLATWGIGRSQFRFFIYAMFGNIGVFYGSVIAEFYVASILYLIGALISAWGILHEGGLTLRGLLSR